MSHSRSIPALAASTRAALLFLLSVSPIASAEPILNSLGFSPGSVSREGSTLLSIDVTGATDIEAVFFRRPSGTFGFLPLGEFSQIGTVFSAQIDIPANTAAGDWRISEFGVFDSFDETFRFLASDLYAGTSTCPGFDNIGVFACTSDVVRDNGTLTVNGANATQNDPELLSIALAALSPNTYRLTFEVSNASSVEAVFFQRPSGTFGSLPLSEFSLVGNLFSAIIDIPSNAAPGVWRISEFGVRNSLDETFRFLASDMFPGTSSCPGFENIGVFGCSSEILRDGGVIPISAGGTTVPIPGAILLLGPALAAMFVRKKCGS